MTRQVWAYSQAHGLTADEIRARALALMARPCDAVSWVFHWSDLEPTSALINQSVYAAYTFIQDAEALTSTQGAFAPLLAALETPCVLRVLAGIDTPTWVQAIVPTVKLTPGADNPAGLPCPVLWDDRYQDEFEAFVGSLGRLIAGSPHFANLRAIEATGYGLIGEAFLGRDVAAWETAGWTLATYEAVIAWALNLWRPSRAQSPILDASSGLSGAVAGQMGRQVQLAIAEGRAVQQNGLSATSSLDRLAVHAALGKVPIGAQMVSSAHDPRMGGPLEAALQCATTAGLSWVEVYETDVLDPAFTSALQAFRAS